MSFGSELEGILKLTTIKLFLVLVRETATEWDSSAPGTEVRLAFLNSKYLIRGYITTIQDVDLKKEYIRVPDQYKRRVQKVFATDRSVSFGDERNSFVKRSDCGGNGGSPSAARVLITLT